MISVDSNLYVNLLIACMGIYNTNAITSIPKQHDETKFESCPVKSINERRRDSLSSHVAIKSTTKSHILVRLRGHGVNINFSLLLDFFFFGMQRY